MTETCYFDKKHIFYACDNTDKDCIGCPYEDIIAKTVVTICQWCGKDIECHVNHIKHFCNKDCQTEWLRNRLSYDHEFDGGLYWGEPIFTLEEYDRVQQMLGVRKRIEDDIDYFQPA